MICLNDELTCSQMTDRHIFAPWGLHGGKPGGLGATLVLKAGTQKWQDMREADGKKSTSRYSNVRIRKGDRLRLVSPGGGGYGDPRDRDRELIVNDINQGYVSRTAAERDYGYKEA
jgi:N-methylhydantoinase B/oxoprolinase/acetone carboxylase alpha subunit